MHQVYFHNESYKSVSARKNELKKDLIELKGKDPNIQTRAESCDMDAEIVQLEIDKCHTGSKRKEIESQIDAEVENHKCATNNLDDVKERITKLRNAHESFTEDFTHMKNVCEKAQERTKCDEFNDFTLEEHRQGIREKCEEKKQEFVQKENTANENLQKDLNDLNAEINTFSETKAGMKAELKSITDRVNEKEDERRNLEAKVSFIYVNFCTSKAGGRTFFENWKVCFGPPFQTLGFVKSANFQLLKTSKFYIFSVTTCRKQHQS